MRYLYLFFSDYASLHIWRFKKNGVKQDHGMLEKMLKDKPNRLLFDLYKMHIGSCDIWAASITFKTQESHNSKEDSITAWGSHIYTSLFTNSLSGLHE